MCGDLAMRPYGNPLVVSLAGAWWAPMRIMRGAYLRILGRSWRATC